MLDDALRNGNHYYDHLPLTGNQLPSSSHFFFPLSIVPYKETQQTDKKQQILPPSKKRFIASSYLVWSSKIKGK